MRTAALEALRRGAEPPDRHASQRHALHVPLDSWTTNETVVRTVCRKVHDLWGDKLLSCGLREALSRPGVLQRLRACRDDPPAGDVLWVVEVLDKMEGASRHLSLRLDTGTLGYAARLEGLAMADPRSADA